MEIYLYPNFKIGNENLISNFEIIFCNQKARKTFVTYEGEVKEEKSETKESARTFANQNRKNMPQGTKFQAGRANKNKFKKDQVTTVKQITRPFEDMGSAG